MTTRNLSFFGGAASTTGSMILLEAAGARILLDAGLFEGNLAETTAKNRELPLDPTKVDAILLSQAGLAYAGRVPQLVRHGFKGTIYATPATRDLAAVLHTETALARQHTLSKTAQGLIRKAMTYIQAHYAESLSREEIAEHISISADYLTDCFRQELGITPITYLRRYRIHQACELLRNTEQSITQVALAVGFSDGAHFTRTFTREMGVTPRAFRRNGRG